MNRLLMVLVLTIGAALSYDAQADEKSPGLDLSTVHSVAIADAHASSEELQIVRDALDRWLPGAFLVPRDQADVLIEYSTVLRASDSSADDSDHVRANLKPELSPVPIFDDVISSAYAPEWVLPNADRAKLEQLAEQVSTAPVHWSAKLYRMDCQSPVFGEKPTRPVDGRCANDVFVSVVLGELTGTGADLEEAASGFASAMRRAILNPE